MSVSVLLLLLIAQPQGRVVWSFEANDGVYSSVVIPDVDGDSLPDVVAGIYYGAYPSDPRKAYCVSGATGDTVWVNRSAYGTWGNKGLDAVGDLDGDGFADALLGTAGGYTTPGRSVIALSGRTGDTLWRYSRFEQWGWVYCVRGFVDVDGDTVPDVLAAAGTSSTPPGYAGAGVLVSGRTGAEIWFFRMPADGAQSVAPFIDLDGDGVPEVLLGAGGNSVNDTLYCLSGSDGSRVWQFRTGGSVSDVELIRDVNGSGYDDAVCGGWGRNVHCLEGADGSLLWTASIGTIVMEIVPARDLNGDGVDDVIVGSWDSSVHALSGADGSVLWSSYVGGDVWAVDTLADVTGDGRPEVIAGAVNGRCVRVFDGADGTELWNYSFGERVYDVTGAPDLTGDGWPNVLVGLQDQGNEAHHLFCLAGPPTGVETGGEVRDEARLGQSARRSFVAATVPPGLSYMLRVFDVSGRRLMPPVRGTGNGEVEVSVAEAGPARPLFAVLELADGRRLTAKLTWPAAGR
ncbi:MAG: PQQ-binding-like beta-propeller repeat protein [bacterium]